MRSRGHGKGEDGGHGGGEVGVEALAKGGVGEVGAGVTLVRAVEGGDGARGPSREAEDERPDHDDGVELAVTLEPAVFACEGGDERCGKKGLEMSEQSGMIVRSHGASGFGG